MRLKGDHTWKIHNAVPSMQFFIIIVIVDISLNSQDVSVLRVRLPKIMAVPLTVLGPVL